MKKTETVQLGKKLIGAAIVAVFLIIAVAFFLSAKSAKGEIPAYVSSEKRVIYEWAKTEEGAAILEQIPCYCGCKYDGHMHSRHCFWTDEGEFDKHGVTCSVCLDIAIKAKAMNEQGKGICEIRNTIDEFYKPNAELATPTPMPEGCATP